MSKRVASEELPRPSVKVQNIGNEGYRFDITDHDAWKRYLDANGYVVVSSVLSTEQVNTCFGYIWNFLENLGTGIKRDDTSTWDNNGWPYKFNSGIISHYGIGQSDISWYVRLIPAVRQVFERIWFGNNPVLPLLVSFDGINLFRPFSINSKWKTSTQRWAHIDQNPVHQKGRHAIQGMVNLINSNAMDGGFVCIPKSHLLFEKLAELNVGKDEPSRKFFCLEENNQARLLFDHLPTLKLNAQAGDIILWDSRTIHWNTPPTTKRTFYSDEYSKGLIRAGVYVCMTPISKVSPSKLDIIRKRRVDGVKQGVTTNHWPHFYDPNRPGKYTRKHYGHSEISKENFSPISVLASTPEANRLISGFNDNLSITLPTIDLDLN